MDLADIVRTLIPVCMKNSLTVSQIVCDEWIHMLGMMSHCQTRNLILVEHTVTKLTPMRSPIYPQIT